MARFFTIQATFATEQLKNIQVGLRTERIVLRLSKAKVLPGPDSDELDDALVKGPLQDCIWLSNTYSSKYLAESMAMSFVRPIIDDGRIVAIVWPILDTFVEKSKYKIHKSSFARNFPSLIESNYSIAGNPSAQITFQLMECTELLTTYKSLLELDSQIDASDFKYELGILENKLLSQLNKGIYPKYVIYFLLTVVGLYLGDLGKVNSYSGSISIPTSAQNLGLQIQQFTSMIQSYMTAIIPANFRHSACLVPSSPDQNTNQAVQVLTLLDLQFKEKHALEITYAKIDQITSVPKLVAELITEDSKEIILMGHGNATLGVEVLLANNSTYMKSIHLVDIEAGANNVETFVILSCEGGYFTELVQKFTDSPPSGDMHIVYCNGIFSFIRMELFCAGYLRGRSLARSFNECVELGRSLLFLRLQEYALIETWSA